MEASISPAIKQIFQQTQTSKASAYFHSHKSLGVSKLKKKAFKGLQRERKKEIDSSGGCALDLVALCVSKSGEHTLNMDFPLRFMFGDNIVLTHFDCHDTKAHQNPLTTEELVNFLQSTKNNKPKENAESDSESDTSSKKKAVPSNKEKRKDAKVKSSDNSESEGSSSSDSDPPKKKADPSNKGKKKNAKVKSLDESESEGSSGN
jgi:hypothetical protein